MDFGEKKKPITWKTKSLIQKRISSSKKRLKNLLMRRRRTVENIYLFQPYFKLDFQILKINQKSQLKNDF